MGHFRLVFASTLLLLILLTFRTQAQQSININWQGHENVLPADNLPAKIPAFDGATVDPAERLPYYRFRLPQHIDNFILSGTVYQPFSAEDQKMFGKYSFTASPEVHFVNGTENKRPVAVITLLPIRRNPQTNQLEKLTAFSYKYTSVSPKAADARSGSADYASSSVLSSGTWYKLAVTATGVYKVDKSVLQALGVSTQGLDPKTIQLYGNGGGMLPSQTIPAAPTTWLRTP